MKQQYILFRKPISKQHVLLITSYAGEIMIFHQTLRLLHSPEKGVKKETTKVPRTNVCVPVLVCPNNEAKEKTGLAKYLQVNMERSIS